MLLPIGVVAVRRVTIVMLMALLVPLVVLHPSMVIVTALILAEILLGGRKLLHELLLEAVKEIFLVSLGRLHHASVEALAVHCTIVLIGEGWHRLMHHGILVKLGWLEERAPLRSRMEVSLVLSIDLDAFERAHPVR
eukprot:CAMPEP_0170476822 /NCGR_PEP_ID=MMETSP0123-20130129/18166_1 /TAXON_ID=182087 /ORGANISM="Favella ehrenbergii, Strain Fehren 1" /LENGTH=136 /DNA_ID=CAMNT_0010748103 /DNA_START=364 /DNA_END=770 /DNA_ORIENTATION=+